MKRLFKGEAYRPYQLRCKLLIIAEKTHFPFLWNCSNLPKIFNANFLTSRNKRISKIPDCLD
ncbi:MAG: hypothetical protein LBJ00_10655 [Planctomycetaceae bacterium]|nr:hypothetical protein [Planctomycetaceae bacterium]